MDDYTAGILIIGYIGVSFVAIMAQMISMIICAWSSLSSAQKWKLMLSPVVIAGICEILNLAFDMNAGFKVATYLLVSGAFLYPLAISLIKIWKDSGGSGFAVAAFFAFNPILGVAAGFAVSSKSVKVAAQPVKVVAAQPIKVVAAQPVKVAAQP